MPYLLDAAYTDKGLSQADLRGASALFGIQGLKLTVEDKTAAAT
ncbi:hypothetical protein [Paenibacillus sp. GCM10027626]